MTVVHDRVGAAVRQPEFLAGLRRFGGRLALRDGGRSLTYAELDDAVDAAARRLDGPRRLVAVLASRTLDDVVLYLGALRAGHPVVLVPRCRPDAVLARYAPETVVRDGRIEQDVRPVLDRRLHDDLAVLLSTSGTTGSPRLVRLSYANLDSNAAAIVEALRLSADDRAVTTLEISYSYGLSVLHSHLAAGASIVLDRTSVTDPSFADVVRDSGATTLAAVPYTFDVLDRQGGDALRAPALRQVTCAGGRLAPDTARRYAALGADLGWDLVLMYGATEATARMAVLPPELTASRAESAGRAIPGGSFRLADVGADGVGELVYSGPGVMLGYAEKASDLARGRDVHELRTGDRARIAPDGLVEVVGRCAQIAKVGGLRIDLAEVDRACERAGIAAVAVEVDGALGIAAAAPGSAEEVRSVACAATGLPPASVRAAVLPELPRLDSGKVDRAAAAQALAADAGAGSVCAGSLCTATAAVDACCAARLRARYEDLLGVPVRLEDSFADAGGDSLAYVAVSVAVEDTLGHLPHDWHRTPVRELARRGAPQAADAPPRRRTREVETSVLLRALAILAVVASHAGMIDVRGGAHLLMALVGFNLARFQLGIPDPRLRLRRMLRTTAEILVPAFLLMAVLAASPAYEWYLLGATSWTIPTTDGPEWRYWFVEALLWLLPLLALALRVPFVERLRRRGPWLLPASATVLAWAAYQLLGPEARPAVLFAPLAVVWLALLGWTAAEARTAGLRIATSAIVLALVLPSYEASRLWVIPLGLLALIWVPAVRVPRAAVPMLVAVAEASLYIYLTHWLVLGVLDYGWTAVAVSLAVGLATYRGVRTARVRLRRTGATAQHR